MESRCQVPDKNSLGKRIEKYRENLQMSQRDLAKRIGKTGSYISLLESGAKEPSLKTLYKLANILGLPVWTFFTEDIGGIPAEWQSAFENAGLQRLISIAAKLTEVDVNLLISIAERFPEKVE